MHKDRIAEYRAEAATCMARAAADFNKGTAAHWLKMAAHWNRMADDLEDMSKAGPTPKEPNSPS